jgi:hypothetical protein
MGAPTSILKNLKGFARDYPRDRMPEGLAWDIVDYVPTLLDAQATARGGWKYASQALPLTIDGGIYAPYKTGDRLFVISNAHLYEVSRTSPYAVTDRGLVVPVDQNPVFAGQQVLIPDGSMASAPKIITAAAPPAAPTIAAAGANAPTGQYASVYKQRFMVSGGPGFEERVYFSKALDAVTAWDVSSWWGTSLPLTGLGALRAVILLFHAGSVERIRGSAPPDSTATNPAGDFVLENLFDRAGCGDARSIAYWNDNCIFADERGCHMTDGAIVRNLISQGGLVIFWRALFRDRISLAACTYLDYYIITIVRSDGTAVTLICDLNRRAWFRFTNIKASCYIRSIGTQEEAWAGNTTAKRLISMAETFFPSGLTTRQDEDGTPVLPVLETAWERLSEEGRKRVRFIYASYDVRAGTGVTANDWRHVNGYDPREEEAEPFVGDVNHMVELSYMTTVSGDPAKYVVAGALPATTEYSRKRLPVGRHPYGLALRVRGLAGADLNNIFDLGIEAASEERSRI